MVASHILSLLSFGEELVPDTLETIFSPSVLTLTVFFAIFDQGCIKLLCPKSWFEPYGEATYWAYVISISYQVCIFIPLGVAVFFLDHNGSYVDLLNSTSHETHGKHTILFAFAVLAYMIRDFPNCYYRPLILFHHIGCVLTTSWVLLEPNVPVSFFMVSTAILEVGSCSNNICFLKPSVSNNLLCSRVFFVGHLVGLLWCYHTYFYTETSFWFRNLIVPEGLAIMWVRQRVIDKRLAAMQAEEENKKRT